MYRTINVSVWQEPWFEELPPNAKLLFFYLLTNSRQTACGAFQVTQRAICHETNLTVAQLRSAMATLTTINKVVWWSDTGWVLLTRFYRHQRAHAGKTYEVAARKAAALLNDTVHQAVATLYPELADDRIGYPYPIDTLSFDPALPTDTLSIPSPDALPPLDAPSPSPSPSPLHPLSPPLPPPLLTPPPPVGGHAPAREAPAPPAVVVDQPYALWEVLCEEAGSDPADHAPAFRNKQLAVARRLLDQGYGQDKVRRCLRYLKSQDWRTSPIDLLTVEKEAGKWELAGSPATAGVGRASPKGRGQLSTQAVADEIDAVVNGARTHDDGSIEARLRHAHGRLAEPLRNPGGT